MFKSVKCQNYESFNQCQCSPVYGCARMGYYANLNKEYGTFYLNTSKQSPFCLS